MPSIWVDSETYKLLKKQKQMMEKRIGKAVSFSHVLKATTTVKCKIKVRKRRKRPIFEIFTM